jgi:hypothetical protein
MFADNREETIYSNKGMLLWGNLNHNFNQATMGYSDGWDFSGGIYTERNWSEPHLITYQESHDEERLMFKNKEFGNSSGSYNVKDLNTALKRNEMATAFWALTPGPKMLWQFGELGYDYSINTCEDGSIDNNCRTSPKPIRWEYLADPARLALYNVYAKLLRLRNVPNLLPTFITNDISDSLGGGFKWLKVNSDSLKIFVVGNFDVVNATATVAFQDTGTWYDYFSGQTLTTTGIAESISLQPGEYHVYLNKNADSVVNVLPLKLLGFTASRNSDNVLLMWETSNEVNVKQFDVERSFNAFQFDSISTILPKNLFNNRLSYTYGDKDRVAIKSDKKIYYRLKMIDIDGSYRYSNVAAVNPFDNDTEIRLYPNPVKGSEVFIKFMQSADGNAYVRIEDLSGRIVRRFVFKNNSYNRSIPVNVSGLTKGVYILKVETSNKTSTHQLVLQ